MDEVERQVLEGQRTEAIRKRDQLQAVIDYFNEVLGVTSQEQGEPAPVAPPAAGAGSSDVSRLVNEGEFYGLSATKATKALLERVGKTRPLKTAEIFEAIRRGGVSFKSKEGLYKSLDRDPMFHKVGRGRWGLTAWYGKPAERPSGKHATEAEESAESPAATDPSPSPNGHQAHEEVSG